MRGTKVFVSYATRDWPATHDPVLLVESWLVGICLPFIHRPGGSRRRLEQFRVIGALLQSDILLVLESPGVHRSTWVRLELLIARLKMMPIVRIPAASLYAGTT